MTAARLVARTVRGIEPVVADEIATLHLGRVSAVAHREVWFDRVDPGPEVLDLRCADDVFLVGTVVYGIGRSRADLRMLSKAASALPLRELLTQWRRCGGAAQHPTPGSTRNDRRPPRSHRSAPLSGVDVSASFLGRRNFTRFDLEDAVGEPIAAALGLPHHSRRGGIAPPPGGLSWRVTLVDDRALVALRIADRPLHRRAYRRMSRPGSLHPPVAAALVRVAGARDGDCLLDPCCGAGTIPVEAALAGRGLSIMGGDIDRAVVAIAAGNGGDAPVGWVVADAGRIPLPDGAVDLVVTNPPWDRQVPFAGVLAGQQRRFWTELRRVLRPAGRAVLLLSDMDGQLPDAETTGLTLRHRYPISLSGTHPEIALLRAR
ncbi:methyltransferase domain-containing protein [Micromonospora sp. WMMD1102]|uniref:methyltransferase domain-containing protein n=1 Tax=Micromonospora sp. WMMD1102 TaxID=3016105 RepID=UPI00241542AD|nr:methyltransferase domain-containing protein [Micromonospora sp. WMMD1102]MDG4789779.1 methyltransferase domain-containing protein [Micromonospora sp. WMMD1102]